MRLKILTIVGVLLGLVVLGLGVKALLDDEGSERTVEVGDITVSIPTDTPTDELLVAMWRDFLPQTGFYPSYRQCLLEALEAHDMTAIEIEELAELSDEARVRKGLALSRQFEQDCKREDGEDVFDPGATIAQIDLVRETLARGLRAELEGEFGPMKLACFEREVNDLPASEIVAIMNGTEKEIEAVFFEMGKRCA